MEFNHKSVLLHETIEGLNVTPEGTYVDGTLGGAGHSIEIVKRLKGQGRLIGLDKDGDAIIAAGERLRDFENVTIIRNDYRNMKEELNNLGIEKVNGIMLDLGVSSYQLDTKERGFSYKEEAELDMRMDTRCGLCAKDIVNTYSQNKLFRIIRDYGEDKFAQNIAKHIVNYRENVKPIETTTELADIIKNAVPMKIRKQGGHPAKQTFQAIRIELNGELSALSESLMEMIDMLNVGGRICIITFHSLEDRIVKNIFKDAENPCTCPKNLPCVCNKKSKGKIITRKPITPTEDEISLNPRAKSAKLRIFEHI